MSAESPSALAVPLVFVPVMDNYGGIERNLIALSAFWHRQGRELEILCFRCRANLQEFSDHPLRITELTASENPFVRAKILASFLDRRFRETGLAPLLFGIKGAFYMGMRCPGPFVLHFTDPPSLLGLRRPGILGAGRHLGAHWLTRRGVHRAQRMITMTNRNAAELKATYGRDADVVFQGGVPPPAGFSRRPPAPADEMVVLSACRLEGSKRIEWILDAVHRYNQAASGRPAVALIVGRGSAEGHLREYARRLGVAARFPGEIPQSALEEAFASAALFAVPAVQGYGLPVLEALYRDIPVVVHEDSGVAEALPAEQLAVISRGDADDFARDVANALHAVEKGTLPAAPTTKLPTEKDWSAEIARLCRWIPSK